MKTPHMQDHSVKELATRINVAPFTVRRWIDMGLIKAKRLGRPFRIPQSEFDRVIPKSDKGA